MMEVVVTTEAMRHVKPSHHQTNTQLFTGQMPFLSPNQQHQSTEGKKQAHTRLNFCTYSNLKRILKKLKLQRYNKQWKTAMCTT